MLTPPRALVALALATALAAPILPGSPTPPGDARALVIAPYIATAAVPVAPGVTHDWGAMATTKGNQNVHVVNVDPSRPEISFEAALSNDTASGLERTSAMAARRSSEGHRVVAAINGDVWSGYSNLMAHAPNGIHVEDGELMTADSSARPVFGVGPDRLPRIGIVRETMTLTVADGTIFPLDHLNQNPRTGLGLFTARFGPHLSTVLTGTEVVIAGLSLPLRPSGTWTGVVTEVRPAGGGLPIDPATVVLAAPASSLALLALAPGAPVTITTSITPGWETISQAVSGREYLVRDGAPFVSPRPPSASQTHPRSAIGLTAGGQVVMATVDGRLPDESLGITLDELADLMLSRGAVNAINLDGGGSTTLAVRQPGDATATVANTPSDGRERAVTNSIQVVSSAPTGPLAILSIDPPNASVFERGTVAYRLIGQDAAYNPVPLGPGEVSWAVDGPVGTIDPTGRFTATAAGSANVVAMARGLTASVPLTVRADTFPPVAGPPTIDLAAGRTIGAAGVPVGLRWPAATDVGTGVAGYELQWSADGGPWTPVALASPTARAATVVLPRNRTYRIQVRAVDAVGNAGAWAALPPVRLAVPQETTRALAFVRGTWSRTSSPSYDRLNARSTRTRNGVVRFTFTGTAVAWVSARSPVRGTAQVSVDGGAPVTVDLYATKSVARQMVFYRSWPTSGLHTLEIRALGTAGHPRVDVDAFVVLTPGAS